MNGLYPIIRRARRPLIIEDDDSPALPPPPPVPVVVPEGGVTYNAATKSKPERKGSDNRSKHR